MVEGQNRQEFEGYLSQSDNFTNESIKSQKKMKPEVVWLEEIEKDASFPVRGTQDHKEQRCTKCLIVVVFSW